MGGEKGTRLLTIFLMMCMIQLCGTGCDFKHNPISSTFDDIILDLKLYLPLDYPVTTVSNLITENHCFDIWQLYFHHRELKRIAKVSGEELGKKINKLSVELEFIEKCGFQVASNCLIQEKMNISIFLDRLLERMTGVKEEIKNEYSHCTNIMCKQEQKPEAKQNFFLSTTAAQPHNDQQWGDNVQQRERSTHPNKSQFCIILVSLVFWFFLIFWIN